MILLLISVCQSVSLNFIPKTKSPPSQRAYQYIDFIHSRSSLIIFGGASRYSALNDLWEFSLASLTWNEIVPFSPQKPCNIYLAARINFGAFASKYKSEFYVVGGRTDLGPNNELWVYKFYYFWWDQIETFNKPAPTAIFGFTNYIEDSNEFFVIQGGITIGDEVNFMFR